LRRVHKIWRKSMNHKWRNGILKKYRFFDTGTYCKRPFTNHCYVDVVTSYSSRTVLRHTEHKKQLLYFLERHRISYHHGYGHRTALIWIRWDYHVWRVLEQRVYCTCIRDISHLKTRLVEEWQKFLPEDHWLGDQVMHSTRRTLWAYAVKQQTKLFTDHWLPAMLTANFQRCISDINKMDVVAWFSKLISHPSCLDVWLLCLKFHTKLTRFYWIIVTCFGVHFLWDTV